MLLDTEDIEVGSRDNDGLTPLSHAARYPAIVTVAMVQVYPPNTSSTQYWLADFRPVDNGGLKIII